MTASLARQLHLQERELVALVGGGGKTTLLMRLGAELASRGRRVLLTTTTKMGRDEVANLPAVCREADPATVRAALAAPGPLLLVTGDDGHKATGPPPEVVDRLFAETQADYVIVEADGSRRLPLKAPGPHEPVIPATATLVVVMMGVEAVGRTISEAAHRAEVAARLIGADPGDRLSAQDCAAVLAHPEGGIKGAPEGARVVVALTGVRGMDRSRAAEEIGRRLEGHDRISSVVTIP